MRDIAHEIILHSPPPFEMYFKQTELLFAITMIASKLPVYDACSKG
jgi:hypothetical protein